MTYELDLQSKPILGQGRPHAKNQGQRSNFSQESTHKLTNGQTEATKYIVDFHE